MSGAAHATAEEAFCRWRDLQPYKGATEREHSAFLAGFGAATTPIKSMAELEQLLLASIDTRKTVPPGVCQDCEGEGEQGGQFCGGYWTCETCKGTGKAPAATTREGQEP